MSEQASDVSIKNLLEAGVHLGHSKRYWNPKTNDFIFTMRNKLHIIDLRQTLDRLNEACKTVTRLTELGQNILFVGTKRNIADIVQEQAIRAGMPYVNRRWLGGMLTNHRTLKSTIARLHDLEYKDDNGLLNRLAKKEMLKLQAERKRLERNIGGVKNMDGLPRALFVVDVSNEKIAVLEAAKIRIPVIAVVDTNSDPNNIDFPIPGNDDSQRSVSLLVETIANACIAGAETRAAKLENQTQTSNIVKVSK